MSDKKNILTITTRTVTETVRTEEYGTFKELNDAAIAYLKEHPDAETASPAMMNRRGGHSIIIIDKYPNGN